MEKRLRQRVLLAYLQQAKPELFEVLQIAASQAERVLLVPVLLLPGGHMLRDVPQRLAQAETKAPGCRFETLTELSQDPRWLRALAQHVAAQAARSRGQQPALLVTGRGSAEPKARAALARVATQIAQLAKIERSWHAFVDVCRPSSAELLLRYAPRGPLIVLPYLLAGGQPVPGTLQREVAQAQARHPQASIQLLEAAGRYMVLADVLSERIREALAAGQPG